jgi:hypothetical protein
MGNIMVESFKIFGKEYLLIKNKEEFKTFKLSIGDEETVIGLDFLEKSVPALATVTREEWSGGNYCVDINTYGNAVEILESRDNLKKAYDAIAFPR